jgi:hypothetical protein
VTVNKSKKRGWFRSDEHHDRAPDAGEAASMPPAGEVPELRGGEESAIDMRALLDAAGVSHDERDRVDRARALLHALPTGVSAAIRRQIVEASLTTFGVPTDLIAEAGQKVSDALASFIAANRQATDRLLDESRARVQALEQEILRVRQATEHAATAHEKRIREANSEMVAVNQVLAFFGGAIAEVEELDEPTEDRSGWGVELPIPPPPRLKRDSAKAPSPPAAPGDPAGKPQH